MNFIKRWYYKSRSTNILKGIKVDDELLDLFEKHNWAVEFNVPTTLETARECLNILCRMYNIPELKTVRLAYYTDFMNAPVQANYTPEGKIIRFSMTCWVTMKNIFHEFAHHLDFMVNLKYKQTLVDGLDDYSGCNQEVPDTFFNNYRDRYIELIEERGTVRIDERSMDISLANKF